MIGSNHTRDLAPGPTTIDTVRNAVLELLAALPERPERLRVHAADVTVELEWPAAAEPPSGPVTAGPVGPPSATGADAGSGHPADGRADLHYVCAPTVGTFYHAPEPGATPFAPEGALVSAGQQIGIVEAMKLMLPVEADSAGRVVEVLAVDGQPVEYGQRLIALAPADPA